ncbi:MAG: hypothetical protein AAF438_17925 [Pseudomonadota bacterium]
MTQLSVGKGMLMGFLISGAGAICMAVLGVVFSLVPLVKFTASLCCISYLLFLVTNSPAKVGRWVTVLVWGILTTVTWYFAPTLLFLSVQIGLIWLVRSLYHHNTVLAALFDLLLSGFALAVAVWATSETHSVFLALWSFFLVQALFVLIPQNIHRSNTTHSSKSRFDVAQRTAEAALRRLANQ